MRHTRMGWWRIKASLVRGAGALCFSHLVVDFEDHAPGAVLAEVLFVLAADDGKTVHDVLRVIALDAVEVKAKRVELTAHRKAAIIVPDEGRSGARELF